MFTFGEAIGSFYKRYFDFSGRSQRSEYWWFQVYFYAALIGMIVMSGFMTGGFEEGNTNTIGNIAIVFIGVFYLVHVIGMISLAVRRFHDLGQTGWLILVFGIAGLIPLVGLLCRLGQFIWFMFAGTDGSNKYGPDPLHGEQADIFT